MAHAAPAALIGVDSQPEHLDQPPHTGGRIRDVGERAGVASAAAGIDAQVIALGGAIDPGMVIALHQRMGAALDAGHRRIVVDLSSVTDLGRETANALCGALRRLSRRGASVAIAGCPPHLRRLLQHGSIDRVEFYATGDPAMLALLLGPADVATSPPPTSSTPTWRAPSFPVIDVSAGRPAISPSSPAGRLRLQHSSERTKET
jgi:anti-anti-sigma regulatory factor